MISAESFVKLSSGVDLCYQTYGNPSAEPLLLIMGLGGPMTWWDSSLCARFADSGFFVIRYDNRDTGRSTKLEGTVSARQLAHTFASALRGSSVRPPYHLSDLALDACGLLDHLGISSAHVAGMSMGGMIAQTVAIEAPERLRSLTSVMSTTGRRTVGWQHPSLIPTLLAPRARGREEYTKASVALWQHIGSPAFPTSIELMRSRAEETWDRGFSSPGVRRQLLAIIAQPDRTTSLRQVTQPSLVIHGRADKMVHHSGGRATAAALPNSELMLIDGMGHDLPFALHDTFVQGVRRVADRSSAC